MTKKPSQAQASCGKDGSGNVVAVVVVVVVVVEILRLHMLKIHPKLGPFH